MNFNSFLQLFNQTVHKGNNVYAVALYSQAVLETGNFSSNIYNSCKNLFGMKPALKREKFYTSVYDSPNGESFAVYESAFKSLLDRMDLDNYNNISIPDELNEVSNYINSVSSKGYATAPNYAKSWSSQTAQNVLRNEDLFDIDEEDNSDQNSYKFSYKWIIYLGLAVGLFFLYKYIKNRFLK